MKNHKADDNPSESIPTSRGVDLQSLVRIIGYQLTAFIARTKPKTVQEWIRNGLPRHLAARMQAALDVAGPIEKVESELVAQGFLTEKQTQLHPFDNPAEMLRDADVSSARAVVMGLARKEFLDNVATDLGDVEHRLNDWIAQAKMPAGTAYSVGISSSKDRLWLQLIHTGFSLAQVRRWDRGHDWPCWAELVLRVPEMAASRTVPDLQTGFPFKYLRRAEQK